ncbi:MULTISPECIES: hypothetical protein [unclassified Sinorhizobium]|uniref:hypothetical protein n=1 Tax=unclassified Sinorhizobium TaxID=2613772 RepID=UPI003525A02E
MSRQYDAKQAVLKAYPDDIQPGVDLFLEYLDVSEDDFRYEEGMSAAEYIYGPDALLSRRRHETHRPGSEH